MVARIKKNDLVRVITGKDKNKEGDQKMSSALMRGRTLDHNAVAEANKWRENRKKVLWGMLQKGTAGAKELRELSRLEGRRITYDDRKPDVPNGDW